LISAFCKPKFLKHICPFNGLLVMRIDATKLILLMLLPTALFGQQIKHYSLFKPVPKDSMRDMETDRPDFTESPFTVDAGHFQYEADFFRLRTQKDASSKQETMFFHQANLMLGLTGSTTIQLNVESYVRQSEKDLATGVREISKGFGDLTLRIKQNLLGNDHGNFAFALMPYVKFPTGKYEEEDRYEVGLIVPMSLKLPHEWKLGMEVETERLKDDEINALHTQFSQSLTISHEIFKHLDGIGETYYSYNFKKHEWSNFLNGAIQLEVSKNFKLDAGVNYGIQTSTENNYFIGAAFRI
jgi:hypothetical protein